MRSKKLGGRDLPSPPFFWPAFATAKNKSTSKGLCFITTIPLKPTPSTVIAQIPSLLFQIGVSEMDNDQQREIIMIGFADCRRARADKISGLAVGRKDFNLSMTASRL